MIISHPSARGATQWIEYRTLFDISHLRWSGRVHLIILPSVVLYLHSNDGTSRERQPISLDTRWMSRHCCNFNGLPRGV